LQPSGSTAADQHYKNMFKPLLLVAGSLILFFGCGPEAKDREEARARLLLEEIRTWKCHLQSLHASSVALWDSVNVALNAELPPEISADEKRNLLAVRNSGLIQMFEIYPKLDAGTQEMVAAAGARDSTYAAEMRRAHDSLEVREASFRKLLMEWEETDPQAYPAWESRLSSLVCEQE
jgi:hypothetical protein